MAADCARLSATAASPIRPWLSAASSKVSKRALAPASPSASAYSSSTVQGAAGSGWASCGKCRRTSCSEKVFITSKPVSPAPSRAWARPSRATHWSSDVVLARAVRLAAGCGCSLSVAAVMMPSVPSLPMNRSRRS